MGAFQAALWILIFMQIQASITEACFVTDEFSPGTFKCTKNEPLYDSFTSFGPRIEINGSYPDFGSCDINQTCYSVDASMYTVSSAFTSTTQEVILEVTEVDRAMTGIKCFKDGVGLSEYCPITVYVKGESPVCEEPVFTNGGTTAEITCVSETIYPEGRCTFNNDLSQQNIESTNTPVGDNGDQRLECTLQFTVAGTEANTYSFLASVKPYVKDVDIPDTAEVSADAPVYLTLQPIALFNANNNAHVFDNPDNGMLSLDIPITGNPEPNRHSLSVMYDEETTSITLSSDAYSVRYAPSVGGAEDGIITLNVMLSGLDLSDTNRFTFKADNGVLTDSEMEYYFTVVVESDGSNGVLIAVLAGVGGFLLIAMIVGLIVIVCHKKKRSGRGRHNECQINYIYPNEGFSGEGHNVMFPPTIIYSEPPAYKASGNQPDYSFVKDDVLRKSHRSAVYADLDDNSPANPPDDNTRSDTPRGNSHIDLRDSSSRLDPQRYNSAFDPPIDYLD